jgi:hypothetical protein
MKLASITNDTDQLRLKKIVVAIISIFLLVNLEAGIGANLLDMDKLVIPFIYLTLPVLLLSKMIGWDTIVVLRNQFVSIGVIVSLLNLVALLNDMNDAEQVLSYLKFTYGPLSIGILLSYFLFMYDRDDDDYEVKLSRLSTVILSCISIIAVVASWFSISPSSSSISISALVDVPSTQIIIVVLLNGYLYRGFKNKNLPEKLCQSSIFCCIVAAVLGIAYYAFAAGQADPKLLGPVIATALLSMLYGVVICYFSTNIGGKDRLTIKEAAYMDWHVIESYIFLTLMVFPPLALLELASLVESGGLPVK